MINKVYIDMCENSGCAAIFNADTEIIYAGTTLFPMRARDRNETYRAYADQYDLKFIFDDDVPQIDFYTVPQVDLFARDSHGGLFGTVGQFTDINDIAPICYIDKNRACFFVADSLKAFLHMFASGCDWKSAEVPADDILFFKSRADAEQSLPFADPRRKAPNVDLEF